MSAKEIAVHNRGLNKVHPYFIRCRREQTIGSLASSQRVCKTNQDWSQHAELSRRAARDAVDRTASGHTSGQ
jgi:hypothetical protein